MLGKSPPGHWRVFHQSLSPSYDKLQNLRMLRPRISPVKTIPTISRRDLLKGLRIRGPRARLRAHRMARDRNSPVSFLDVASAAGITFRHDNAASSEKYLIETMGAGCGWIDYNQDGLLDLYLVNSAATSVYRPAQPLRSALYRNNGDGTFYRCHRKRRRGRRRSVRNGRRRRRLRQRRLPRSARTRLWTMHSLPQQRERHLHRCDRACRR